MKFIFVSFDGISFPIAYKLLQEGNEVKVAQIQNNWELGNQDKPEDFKVRKKRLSLYDGVLEKMTMPQMLSFMRTVNKDDWFVIFDFNTLWKYSEQVLKMGFKKGFFPTKEDFELEKDRDKGKEVVEKNYKLEIGEVQEFKKAKDAIDFLQKSNETYVLKGYDLDADTVCPNDKVDELARLKLINVLTKNPKDYEKKGFILETKVKDPIEITPEAQFYDGKLVMVTADIESKPISAGDEGKQCGCSQNLIIQLDESNPICKLAFPPYVQKLASKHVGLFVWDASILFGDKPYFGEFCANRWGWSSIQTQLAMCESVTSYFENIVKGKNPLKYKFGFGLNGFNDDIEKGQYVCDRQIAWLEETDKDTWVYDLKQEEELVNTGFWEADLVVFTGAGNTPEEALNKAHKARDNFSFSNLSARPKFDFDADYPTSIGHRYKYFQKYEN